MSEWKIGKLKPEEEPGAIVQVQISKVLQKKAIDVFGEVAKDPEKQILVIYAVRGKKEISIGNLALPEDLGAIHPKSNAAKFLLAYGKAPKAGLKVNVRVDANGFWKLVL